MAQVAVRRAALQEILAHRSPPEVVRLERLAPQT